MSKEDVNRVENELEHEKDELREDFRDIKGRLEETRAELSPSKFVEKRPLFFLGASLVLGFAFGCGRGRPKKLEKLSRVAALAPGVFAA